ncbi:SDR family NAD(P)-dependent oxidoreductase [Actinomycetospora sp. CA-084318]|uniref:SDR family NAD(P)-dependent oxidoreductase n=1 Tax=Actinomycetospora sp. CA-084318 TaxID=3239892 RepID=UPI003D99ED9B
MRVDLAGLRTALITGASSGIGLALAEALAARGHDLVLVARNRTRLETLAEQMGQRYGVAVEVLAADLTDPDDLARVGARLTQPERPVDLLFNNAGDTIDASLADVGVDRLRSHVALNLGAVLALTRTAVPAMVARGRGAVVNVASVDVFVSKAGPAAVYSAGKLWVTVLTESLARELRGTGVHAMALCPGLTDTEFSERNEVGDTPPRRLGARSWSPADMAEACLGDLAWGRVVSVPGARFRVTATLGRLVPYRPLGVLPALARRRRSGLPGVAPRRALITSADSDLSAAVARALRAGGAEVVLVGRAKDRMDRLVESLGSAEREAVEVVVADLAVPADREDVGRRLQDRSRPVDLVVLGVERPSSSTPFSTTPLDVLQRDLQAGPMASLEVLRVALSALSAGGGGRIVTLPDAAGLSPGRGATEAFLLSLTRSLGIGVLGSEVDVVAVIPSRTGLSRRAEREITGATRSGSVVVAPPRVALVDLAGRVVPRAVRRRLASVVRR